MKLNSIFKGLIDLAFYLMVPIVVFFPGTILYIFMFPQQSIFKVNIPYTEQGFGTGALLFMICFFILFLLFFAGFYQLRKFASQLLKKKPFSSEVIKSTKKVGQFFTACGFGALVFIVVNSILTRDREIHFSLSILNFSFFVFLLLIGTVFLLLGKAFSKEFKLKTV
ncbi:MAG: DUF2975 domain-containing protein [Bacteroidota bacterium]|nr:DUF2975 domain-containing protein [Bacteroidota bacterium]